MTRCPTKSGPFQCTVELDANGKHAGECITRAANEAPPGPAGDAARASQHLRAILDVASGDRLNGIGVALKILRHEGEPCANYRERIWAAR